jgi:hypothetical protein
MNTCAAVANTQQAKVSTGIDVDYMDFGVDFT